MAPSPEPARPSEAAPADALLQQVEAARLQRDSGVSILHLIGMAIAGPAAPGERAAGRLRLIKDDRKPRLALLLKAAIQAIQAGVVLENTAVDGFLRATAVPPSSPPAARFAHSSRADFEREVEKPPGPRFQTLVVRDGQSFFIYS